MLNKLGFMFPQAVASFSAAFVGAGVVGFREAMPLWCSSLSLRPSHPIAVQRYGILRLERLDGKSALNVMAIIESKSSADKAS